MVASPSINRLVFDRRIGRNGGIRDRSTDFQFSNRANARGHESDRFGQIEVDATFRSGVERRAAADTCSQVDSALQSDRHRVARMGRTVTSLRPTQAEDASARLQQGVRSGRPVMIPGAWELRQRRPIVPASETRTPVLLSHVARSSADRERLEHAREGGGAPSQRRTPQRTILAKMWRSISRPTGAAVV